MPVEMNVVDRQSQPASSMAAAVFDPFGPGSFERGYLLEVIEYLTILIELVRFLSTSKELRAVKMTSRVIARAAMKEMAFTMDGHASSPVLTFRRRSACTRVRRQQVLRTASAAAA